MPSDGKTVQPITAVFSLNTKTIPNIAENSLPDEVLKETDPATVRALKEAKRQEELKKAAEEEARRAAQPPPESIPLTDIVE